MLRNESDGALERARTEGWRAANESSRSFRESFDRGHNAAMLVLLDHLIDGDWDCDDDTDATAYMNKLREEVRDAI